MKKRWLLVFAALLGVVMIAGVILLEFAPPLTGWPEKEIVFQIPSPDGRYTACGLHWYVGAAGSNTTEVTIRPSGEKEDPRRNHPLFTIRGTSHLEAAWETNSLLTVRTDLRFSLPEKEETSWREVSIRYVQDAGKRR